MIRISRRLPALLLALLLSASLFGQEITGKVVGVSDGDTITVLQDKTQIKVRLNGIDCPESGQPFGERAKQFTSALCFGDIVTVKTAGKDRYGRTLGDVVLTDGRVLNQELLKAGMAWWYREFSKDNALEAWEAEARQAKRGLWSDPNVVAPWEWRNGRQPTAEETSQRAEARAQAAPKAAEASQTVYITASGKKYHADGCRYLAKSKIATTVADAVSKGYSPCSACRPPVPAAVAGAGDEGTVGHIAGRYRGRREGRRNGLRHPQRQQVPSGRLQVPEQEQHPDDSCGGESQIRAM